MKLSNLLVFTLGCIGIIGNCHSAELHSTELHSTESHSAELKPMIIGEAYDIKHNTLLYREYHYSDGENSQRVVYKDPAEQVIAEKELSFANNSAEPSMEQSNELCGEYIKVSAERQEQRVNIVYRADRDAREKQKQVKKSDRLVIDAGFNYFVQTRWDSLLSGKTLPFQYLVPSRLRTYAFNLRAASCPGEGAFQCFAIEPDVWYLDLVLDPILLTYTRDTKMLMGFTGLGNIANEKCDYLAVDIRYKYLSDSL